MEGAWGQPATLFPRLAGRWRIAREIGRTASLQGEAVFAQGADGALRYRESGRLLLVSGNELEAERHYIFRAAPDGFAVFFAEPPHALFHEIALRVEEGTLTGEAAHDCQPDNYLSRYLFAPDGSFTVRHRVTGPRKDYESVTVYRRV